MTHPIVGSCYLVPLYEPCLVYENGRPTMGTRRVGEFGAVRILATTPKAMVCVTLDYFGGAGDTEGVMRAERLICVEVQQLHRGGPGPLASGDHLPDDWDYVGLIELSASEQQLSEQLIELYQPNVPMWRAAQLQNEVGDVLSGLSQVSKSLAIEWRCRFDRDALLVERTPKPVATPSKMTWETLPRRVFSGYPPSLQTTLDKAYAVLLSAVGPDSSEPKVVSALTEFFRSTQNDRFSGEYRDEIAAIAARVGEAWGLEKVKVYRLAEDA